MLTQTFQQLKRNLQFPFKSDSQKITEVSHPLRCKMALAFLSGPLQAHILVPKAVNLGVSGPTKTLFIGQPKLCTKSGEQWYTCKHVSRRWKASNNDMPAASNDFDLSQCAPSLLVMPTL